jgi:predicted nucleic acid-binding protein
MLCDTGPMVALIDRKDPRHAECLAALDILPVAPLATTWPCLTEAMYLLHRGGGLDAQRELWSYLVDGFIKLEAPEENDWQGIFGLMSQYRDMPLDFADASLIVTAMRLNDWKLFTVDRRLGAIQVSGKRWLQLVP